LEGAEGTNRAKKSSAGFASTHESCLKCCLSSYQLLRIRGSPRRPSSVEFYGDQVARHHEAKLEQCSDRRIELAEVLTELRISTEEPWRSMELRAS
jgi:hypothetical protein